MESGRMAGLEEVSGWIDGRLGEDVEGRISVAVRFGEGEHGCWERVAPGEGLVDGKGPRFLVASLSKPVVAAAAMQLVERGEITLSTRVAEILKGFGGDGRDEIRLIHLLTHTSGLPDMVPDNIELRGKHASLEDFFRSICRVRLQYRPGTGISYSSMGWMVLGRIIETVRGSGLAEVVRNEIFLPAGMNDSCFGLPAGDTGEGDAQVELPEEQEGTPYHWNTSYWRRLGAPWGGLLSTSSDLLRFLDLFQPEVRASCAATVGRRVLSSATTRAMTRDWTSSLGDHFPSWGLGWKIKASCFPGVRSGIGPERIPSETRDIFAAPGTEREERFFGDLTSPGTIGHTGATGCTMWLDPMASRACVVLTTQPRILGSESLARLANIVMAIEWP